MDLSLYLEDTVNLSDLLQNAEALASESETNSLCRSDSNAILFVKQNRRAFLEKTVAVVDETWHSHIHLNCIVSVLCLSWLALGDARILVVRTETYILEIFGPR